jgi:hypothetical protein
MPILGLCRAGSRLYTFEVVPPCSAGPIATVAPAHRGSVVPYPDITPYQPSSVRIGGHSPEQRIWCRGTFEVVAGSTTVPAQWGDRNAR